MALSTIGRDLAPPALDLCSLLALGEITEPSQLAAKPPVSGQVLCGVVLAAVESDSTPRTLVEGLVLRIHLALGELADPHVPLKSLRLFADFGCVSLCSEHK